MLTFALALSACGGEGEEGGGKEGSGLPGELELASLGQAQREAFCEWYDSVIPSEASCPRGGPADEAAPTCLENFDRFGTCTVEVAERCFASASAGSCELPDTEACEAFKACQEEAAPANDCPDHWFNCSTGLLGWSGEGQTWGTCWNWWPPGCFRCHGRVPTVAEATEWCEQHYPAECSNGRCHPVGPGY